jgi:diguanylate cyclase (GGDEF)-like protein
VNDTYGHSVGDYVLQELITRVSHSIRSDDYLIRWGGEEFVILLSSNSISELEFIAQNLRSAVEKHYFEHVKHITCSFGITLSRDNEPIATTLERADKALYISKETGRNRVTKL